MWLVGGAEIVDCFPFKNETRVYKSRGAIVKSISRLDILSNSNSFNFIFLLKQIVQAAWAGKTTQTK